jgi:pseudoazurin
MKTLLTTLCLTFFILTLLIISKVSSAKTIQIEFTENDTYSIEVAHIDVGDNIEWLPKNEGHNVEFLAGPKMNSLPTKSDIDEVHSVIFKVPGVYLYGCTPHGNVGMLGLIIVGKDFYNLESIRKVKLSRVAKSVLKRLIKIAQSHSKSS